MGQGTVSRAQKKLTPKVGAEWSALESLLSDGTDDGLLCLRIETTCAFKVQAFDYNTSFRAVCQQLWVVKLWPNGAILHLNHGVQATSVPSCYADDMTMS